MTLRDDIPPTPGAAAGELVDASRPLVGPAIGQRAGRRPRRRRGEPVGRGRRRDRGDRRRSTPTGGGASRPTPTGCRASSRARARSGSTRRSSRTGRHRLRILARDAAGNDSAAGPYDVTVRNTPVSCAPGDQRRDHRRAAAQADARCRSGRRRRGSAAARRRAPSCGWSRGWRGAATWRSRSARGARAGADGRYSLRVPKGPSRTLRVGWRRAGEPDFACSRPLSLKVRARVSLRGSKSVPAGRPRATFRGRLIGGYVPRRGKLVLLQGKQAGRSWRTFRAVRTNRQGRFKTRYRFSGARGAVPRPRAGARRGGLPVRARDPAARSASGCAERSGRRLGRRGRRLRRRRRLRASGAGGDASPGSWPTGGGV